MHNILDYVRHLRGFNRNARLFLVSTVLSGLGFSLLVLLYNLYILSLGFRQDMIGLVTAIASIVAVVAALPLGYVANRLGYKWAQIIGMVGSALAIALPLFVPTAEALIVTELFWGVVFTLLMIVGAPFISENSTEAERPYLFTVQFVLITLTAFIGNLFGGELPRAFSAWLGVGPEAPGAYQGALGVGVLLMLASAAPLLLLTAPKTHTAHVARPRLAVRDRGKAARLLAPQIVGALGAGMFIPFTNVFWKVLYHQNDAAIGQIFAASALVMTAASILMPMLTRRWGAVRIMVLAQYASVFGLLAFGFSPLLTFALVGYIGRDVLMNMTRPVFGQFLMDQSEVEERAAISSLSTLVFNLAWAAGSWVSGIWQSEGQFGLMFVVSAVFYLASTWLLQAFFKDAPTPIEAPAAGIPVSIGTLAE